MRQRVIYIITVGSRARATTIKELSMIQYNQHLGNLDLTINIIRCSMNVRRYSLNFAPRPTPRGRDGKELIQCPTSSCDGMGHVSGNYATHRRQGNIDIYTKTLTWTLDYVYIDMAMQHARTHATYRHAHASTHTYIQIVKNLRYLNFVGFLWFTNDVLINILILKQ